MVAGLVAMHLDTYRDSGAELVMGSARFTGPKTIAVDLNAGGEPVLTADTIVLNLGTRPAIPDVPGLREAEPLTNIEALELDALPDHLIVLGGGYVGLELAQAYRRFGSAVTVIERGERIASREDADVADELARLLAAEGIAPSKASTEPRILRQRRERFLFPRGSTTAKQSSTPAALPERHSRQTRTASAPWRTSHPSDASKAQAQRSKCPGSASRRGTPARPARPNWT
ncbi:FAD-dependent oxidoreductase [Methylobacterium currus]|nr:FAD-dependent oxidoreductase [Methylobacterium currus]UHC17641.1 FAD-dependent oxidoreductase [Methylobacterium currus]